MKELDRFIKAQEKDYDKALQEIKNGKKQTHWIWYIFPQIMGLGSSATAQYYEIKSLEEARQYLENEYLKNHLVEITKVLLELENNNIEEVFGYPDYLKVKSCMTLFHYVDTNIKVFKQVIDKFYKGEFDEATLKIIKKLEEVEF